MGDAAGGATQGPAVPSPPPRRLRPGGRDPPGKPAASTSCQAASLGDGQQKGFHWKSLAGALLPCEHLCASVSLPCGVRKDRCEPASGEKVGCVSSCQATSPPLSPRSQCGPSCGSHTGTRDPNSPSRLQRPRPRLGAGPAPPGAALLPDAAMTSRKLTCAGCTHRQQQDRRSCPPLLEPHALREGDRAAPDALPAPRVLPSVRCPLSSGNNELG